MNISKVAMRMVEVVLNGEHDQNDVEAGYGEHLLNQLESRDVRIKSTQRLSSGGGIFSLVSDFFQSKVDPYKAPGDYIITFEMPQTHYEEFVRQLEEYPFVKAVDAKVLHQSLPSANM